MADIFISYSRDDRDIAHALAVALEAAGIGVWWDRELTGGGDFAAEIERHLSAAPLVIVLWSNSSVQSDFVRDESSRARDLRKLMPIRIEPVALPLGFGTLHTLDLIDWDGDPDDDALTEILSQIRHQLKEAATAGPRPTPPLERLRRSFSRTDPLTRRRIQRRLLIGLGLAGIAGAGGIGWSVVVDRREQRARDQQLARQRTALDHLDQAFDHHFKADPPDLKKAELQYRLATEADPTLAEAYFYWAHLTVAKMELSQPKPSRAVLAGLRADAQQHFEQSMALPSLDRGKRALAAEQIAMLATTEPVPLERSTDEQLVAVLASKPNPATSEVAARETPPSFTAATPQSVRPPAQKFPGAIGAGAFGALGSLGGLVGKPPTQTSPTPRPSARPALQAGPARAWPRAAPRIAASPEILSQAEAQATALFSAERDNRVAAQSMLAGNPALAAEALPSALQIALGSLAKTDSSAAELAGLSLTVKLVSAATPAVTGINRKGIEALQQALSAATARAPAGSQAQLALALNRPGDIRPTVFVQIANARQAALARQLADQLEAAGYAIAEIENTGEKRAPSRPEVRSHGGSDPAIARWCQTMLSKLTGADLEDVVLKNLRDIRPDNDVFEIWFDAALCAPGGRLVAGCVET